MWQLQKMSNGQLRSHFDVPCEPRESIHALYVCFCVCVFVCIYICIYFLGMVLIKLLKKVALVTIIIIIVIMTTHDARLLS